MKKVTLIASKVGVATCAAFGLMVASVAAMAEEIAEPALTHDCGYSPKNTALPIVLKAIDQVSGAQSLILVAAYEFTSQPIARALIGRSGAARRDCGGRCGYDGERYR
jgi:hypothetical protein